jgi:hypothetical protein
MWTVVLWEHVALTVQLMVSVFSTTQSGPDEYLDHTASMRRPSRRAAHLLAVPALVLLVMLAMLVPRFAFAPAAAAFHDAARARMPSPGPPATRSPLSAGARAG